MALVSFTPIPEVNIKQGQFDFTTILRNAEMLKNDADTDSFTSLVYAESFTNKEIFRTIIDPGFIADITWLEFYFKFTANGTFSTTQSQDITYLWKIRPCGDTDWIALHSTATVTITDQDTDNDTIKHGFIETPLTSRFEIKLVVNATFGDNTTGIYFTFTENVIGSIRVVGTLT